MSGLVDQHGRPARRELVDDRCPGKEGVRCGAGKDKRVANAGWGPRWPVCSVCGHEWKDEEWHD